MNSLVSLPAPPSSVLSDDAPEARSINWWSLPLVGLISIALCLPFLRTIFSMGDEGVLLHGAERMLKGDRLYADFFEFLPPGGFVLTEAWLRIAGLSMVAVRSLAIITIVGIACFTFLACRQVSRNAPLSAFLTIGWVGMSQGVWTQLSHHWITTMFSMVGVWAALVYAGDADRRWRWPLIAGAASGAASMVTPTCGALALLAALTVFLPMRRHRPGLIAFVLACAVAPVGLLLYLVWHHALVAGFNDVILFTATNYAPIQGLPYGHWANERNAAFLFVFPLAAGLALAVYARERYVGSRHHILLPGVAFGLAGFVACYPRQDIFHIAFEIPLACPLLAYCASRLTETWRPEYRAAAFGAVTALFTHQLLLVWLTAQFMSSLAISPSPRGGLAFFGLDGAPQMLARIAALPAGDGWYFYSFIPMMPFLSGREHVSKYDILTPGYSLPAQYQEACESVMRHVDWVVIDRRGTDPAELKYNFPMMRDPQPPETRVFEHALDSSFEFVARDGNYELRHRRDGVDDSVCAGVTG
jgi:hypothetical protein